MVEKTIIKWFHSFAKYPTKTTLPDLFSLDVKNYTASIAVKKKECLLTVDMGQDVTFNSLKILQGQDAKLPQPHSRCCSKLQPKRSGQTLLWQEQPTNRQKGRAWKSQYYALSISWQTKAEHEGSQTEDIATKHTPAELIVLMKKLSAQGKANKTWFGLACFIKLKKRFSFIALNSLKGRGLIINELWDNLKNNNTEAV